MTAKRKDAQLIGDIEPDRIYRITQSAALFGYGPQRTIDLIKSGNLPAPYPLSASSRFRAWTGAQIIAHRAKMKEIATLQLQAERARPVQPQPQNLRPKVKKQKLRPPSKAAPKSESGFPRKP
jgi:hypothetical protein